MAFSNRRNYYRLLHVQPDAPAEVIKAAYRALMGIHHPDKGGDVVEASLVNEAYTVLSDGMRRAEYDAHRAARLGKAAFRDRRPAPASDAQAASSAGRSVPPRHESNGRECPMCELPIPTPMRRDARCSRCRAPLTPAGKPGGPSKVGERRTMPRVTKSDWAQMLLAWHADPIAVRMRDLSLDGISVYSGASVPVGSIVRVVGHAFDVVVAIVSVRTMASVYTLHARLVTAQFVEQGGFVERTA